MTTLGTKGKAEDKGTALESTKEGTKKNKRTVRNLKVVSITERCGVWRPKEKHVRRNSVERVSNSQVRSRRRTMRILDSAKRNQPSKAVSVGRVTGVDIIMQRIKKSG